jgi:hypothetical protein
MLIVIAFLKFHGTFGDFDLVPPPPLTKTTKT